MSRYLSILALVAVPALLAACDAPKSPLAKAKPGECYTVVGRDSLGKPTLAKTPCAASPEVLAAACPPPATTPPAGCPPTGKAAAKPAGKASTSIGQMSREFSRRFTSRRETGRATASRTASRRTTYAGAAKSSRYVDHGRARAVTTYGDYERVYTPAPQELYGAARPDVYADRNYQRGGGEVYREDRREVYAPLPRQEFGYREEYRGQSYAPPPPPAHGGHGYREERREHYVAPPVEEHYREELYAGGRGQRRSGAVVERSVRESESRSYSESSSSSSSYRSSGHGAVCDCPGGRVTLPPSPFDHDGYLTWRGKTPG